jgi:hypothetical protein
MAPSRESMCHYYAVEPWCLIAEAIFSPGNASQVQENKRLVSASGHIVNVKKIEVSNAANSSYPISRTALLQGISGCRKFRV